MEYAVRKKRLRKIELKRANIRSESESAVRSALIIGFDRYTILSLKRVPLRITHPVMTRREQSSMKMTKMNFPLTVSLFGTGRSTEKRTSEFSLAFWKLWKSPRVTKNGAQSTG